MMRSLILPRGAGLSARRACFISALAAVLLLVGCGNPGSPLPPSLHIPEPVTDLNASRTGDTVLLRWTMPRRNTDQLLLKGDQRAIVCRAIGTQPCTPVATLLVAAAEPASYEDRLAQSLRSGAPRLLRYEVQLKSPRGRDAGASNPAFAAAGAAPPALTHVNLQPTALGILVQWTDLPSDSQPYPHAALFARLQRDRVLKPGEDGKPSRLETRNGVPQPLEQTLESAEESSAGSMQPAVWSPDHALDGHAELNRTYRYTVQLVERLTLSGHSLELSGEPAQSSAVAATDHFPPATPVDLNAVANPDGRPRPTIDLSWSPDSDADLAGYVVYRRELSLDRADKPVRISGAALVPSPAWSDPNARSGVRYAYSVSAVDSSGNESARSAEATETIPVEGGAAPHP